VSAQDTRSLIRRAIESLEDEATALKQPKLALRLELWAALRDMPIWRVELLGPQSVIQRHLVRGRA
jgi:hypothetical protein